LLRGEGGVDGVNTRFASRQEIFGVKPVDHCAAIFPQRLSPLAPVDDEDAAPVGVGKTSAVASKKSRAEGSFDAGSSSMRLRQDKHSAQQFALAVGMPSIDTKVDAANWPPSPLKRWFRPPRRSILRRQ
jgi:hypothetical protein